MCNSPKYTITTCIYNENVYAECRLKVEDSNKMFDIKKTDILSMTLSQLSLKFGCLHRVHLKQITAERLHTYFCSQYIGLKMYVIRSQSGSINVIIGNNSLAHAHKHNPETI